MLFEGTSSPNANGQDSQVQAVNGTCLSGGCVLYGHGLSSNTIRSAPQPPTSHPRALFSVSYDNSHQE